jgi:hydroxyethylthiazole kinase-like sugar kinase family protein
MLLHVIHGLSGKLCSPQAHAKEEVEDFLKIASALVVNVGTLSADWVESMRLAAAAANKLGKPWVLDPVGAGATPFRTKVLGSCGRVCACMLISTVVAPSS